MKPRQPSRRAAFTLLEMMMALAIGVLLLTALYLALSTYFTATNAGRVQVDQAQVARQVLNHVTADIKEHVATLDAYPAKASTSTTAAAAGTPTTSTAVFNLGVQGGTDWCAVYISKVPQAVVQMQANGGQGGTTDAQYTDCDLRRICYFLASGGTGTGGLARQECLIATPADAGNATLPPAGPDELTTILAHEVLSLQFQYWDGTSWQDSWDGSVLGTDGVTPIGPPLSIAITIGVARSDKLDAEASDASVRTFKHVVQIPTASFYNGQQATVSGTSNTAGGSTP